MDAIERKGKERIRLSKRLITIGIVAVFVFLALIMLLIITGMEDLNLTLKGSIQTIEPFAIRIGFIARWGHCLHWYPSPY